MSENLIINRAAGFLDKHFSGEYINSRAVLAIFTPILFDQAFVIIMNLLNTAMISSSGVAAVSAVGMVDSLNIFFVNVIIAVSTGGTVVVAQYRGSGNEPMVSRAASGSVASVFLLAFVLGAGMLAAHGLVLRFLFGDASPEVFHNARIYITGSCLSYCGIALEESVCGALRGVGETKSSLVLSLIMNGSYMLGNFFFIYLFRMGILGMSISVNIARYLAAGIALVYICRKKTSVGFRFRRLFEVRFSMVRRIMNIGLPFAAEQMFFNGGKILTQTFIVGLGTDALAVDTICNSFAMLLQIPSNALCLTTVTVVGQSIGHGNVADARKFTKAFLLSSTVFFFTAGLLLLPLFYPLLSLFHPPGRIVFTIALILFINSVAQVPFWSPSFLLPDALRAAGDSKFTSLVSMLSMWLFRVVLGYILGVVLKFGIIGVWIAMDCEWGIRGTVFLLRFRGTKWCSHHVID